MALRWDDVDIRGKTENSVRLVSIPQTAVDLLIQDHNKHPDSPYLFHSPITGEMYHPDSVVNLHKKILKDAGLLHNRFLDLRHTFATTALQNGVDVKTVSSMLGHYDAGFTLRTYAPGKSRTGQQPPWAALWSRSCKAERKSQAGSANFLPGTI